MKQPSWWQIKLTVLMQIHTVRNSINLGLGEIEQIAASQGRGVTQLMEQVLAPLAEKLQKMKRKMTAPDEKDEWDQNSTSIQKKILH